MSVLPANTNIYLEHSASEYVAVEGMCTMIFDLFPKLGANQKQRPIIIGLVTKFRFLLTTSIICYQKRHYLFCIIFVRTHNGDKRRNLYFCGK